MTEILNLSRRAFLLGTAAAGGGLLLGCPLPSRRAYAAGPDVAMGAWLRISPDGGVTVFVEKSEMGQGVYTALPALVAEELGVDWKDVRVEAPVLEGPERRVSTGGSTSVRRSWDPLCHAGAAAREMLVSAAAEIWAVSRSECEAAHGRVSHRPTGRTLGYGELAETAAALPVPESVRLKPRSECRLIGRPLPRLDTPAKVRGTAVFGIDVKVPEMLHAALRMSPVLDGHLARYDEEAALSTAGVRAVVEVPGGVAVVADDYWQATRGLEALAPVFEDGDAAFDSETYSARLHQALNASGVLTHETGTPSAVLEAASEIFEARYEVPFLAHVTMEPMNCTAHVSGKSCEIWAPTQNPAASRRAAAEVLGIPVESVRLHTTLLGGGFGRRNETDFVVQAVLISRAVAHPVKLIWSREEDIRHDFFRPAYASLLRSATDSAGLPIAWSQRVAGPSFTARNAPAWLRRSVARLQCSLGSGLVPDETPDFIEYRFPNWIRSGADGLAVGGAGPGAYRVPHHRVEYSLVDTSVPVGWWRSVSHSQNVFFTECFTDELAHRAGRDPYQYRRALLANAPRERRVLDRAARAAGWGAALPAGSGRGIAFSSGFGSHVCEVAEVSQGEDGTARVDRVVCVIDCGQIVNPDTIRAQMEGGIVFGLSAALHEKVTLRAGAVEQANLNDYRLLGLAECPEIEVHIVDSDAPPGGVGEPGTPPIAPAVANAIFAATGRRIRRLPLAEQLGS